MTTQFKYQNKKFYLLFGYFTSQETHFSRLFFDDIANITFHFAKSAACQVKRISQFDGQFHKNGATKKWKKNLQFYHTYDYWIIIFVFECRTKC